MKNEINLNFTKPNEKYHLNFKDKKDYYYCLGHLVNENSYSIRLEENNKSKTKRGKSKAWGQEKRIHILKKAINVPATLERKATVDKRLNCTEFINQLLDKNGFQQKDDIKIIGRYLNVVKTVPKNYVDDFNRGYKDSFSYNTNNEKDALPNKRNKSNNNMELHVIDVSSLTPNKTETKIKKKVSAQTSNQNKKTDYIQRQIRNQEIGKAGERIVYNNELNKLNEAVKNGLIECIEDHLDWISLRDDSAGYDIRSYDVEKKQPIYIEVKTTTGPANSQFYISDLELRMSKKYGNKYRLYRVYDVFGELGCYVLRGDIRKIKEVDINPVKYFSVNLT